VAFLIVFNSKELDVFMGLLLFFISNDNFFFKFLKDGSLNYLVVIIGKPNNIMCCDRNATFVGI
jgi:hypothetical protein